MKEIKSLSVYLQGVSVLHEANVRHRPICKSNDLFFFFFYNNVNVDHLTERLNMLCLFLLSFAGQHSDAFESVQNVGHVDL